MSVFSDRIKFKYPWRSYQKRVLDALDEHLSDEHLHVIAPPGSGKTVLGLEVMLRIGAPTLILAPTIAIRNQWIQRFCELFLQEDNEPDWITCNIHEPKLITVATYQSLHAACDNKKEELIVVDYTHEYDVIERKKSNFLNLGKVVQGLKAAGVKTIVVDEAHHLKSEWWKTLSKVKNAIKPKIVGLTATPPYDVSPNEWARYIELNGPVDAEISVPELIQEGDLCVHQDYLYLCEADAKVKEELVTFRDTSAQVLTQLLADPILFEAMYSHPFWLDPMANQELLYAQLSHYSACLVYLHHRGVGICPSHLEILGVGELKRKETVEEKLKIPRLTPEWMQELLAFYLSEEDVFFGNRYDAHRKSLARKLKRVGLLERKTVRFEDNEKLTKDLAMSVHKLQAIEDIVELEFNTLRRNLRQVILTDYIRREFLTTDAVNTLPLTKIGVVPIFEQLRRKNTVGKKIAILSGTLIILPRGVMDAFEKLAYTLSWENVHWVPLAFDTDYVEVIPTELMKGKALRIVTSLFESGEVEVLIGTKSLLGEGWDAPAINSLILASFVGSYVLSNQMRGRAIRSKKDMPDKTSNIWHIAALDPTSRRGGSDLSLMKRRFKNFVGISEYEISSIENGKDRLQLPELYTDSTVQAYNTRLFELARNRSRLAIRWQEGMRKGTRLVEEVWIPYAEGASYQQAKTASMKKYINNMLVGLGSSLLFFMETSTQVLGKFMRISPGQSAGYAIMGMFGVAAVFYGRQTVRSFQYYRKYRDITKDIYQIGNALLMTVCKAQLFHTPIDELKVLTFGDENGNVYCHMEGGTVYEQSRFIQMIQEIVNPVDEPRFIIVRKSKVLGLFNQQDYHAVPVVLGKKTALATDFLNNWQQQVGKADLYYTKTFTGRQILLRSRFNALANQFAEENKVQAVSIWR
ncbi:DEAD/DEAH box helicase family protein [Sphingobacterium paucimobilis]|uniref:Helicase ATP-binding domain-containing protein n=1 Tax=Sphingobacterium paucimobilis HER1398 TaxID=1346330 RepID=U2IZZ6_9SPHI|nr:DEAD/DEAH box helicase family protein [Sphingobacterium paucimobilis]ERJ58279.1 hypothetical protein M472_05830 [Sphingobacterium paucimobilis HER1398]